MQKIVLLAMLSALALGAQSPDLTGVWKADLQKSKLNIPPDRAPTNYLVIIERKTAIFNHRTKETAPQIVETTGTWTSRGEHRSVLTVFDNGKPAVLPYEGVPTRLTASVGGQYADHHWRNGRPPGYLYHELTNSLLMARP